MEDQDGIKEAFNNVKNDINFLNNEVINIKTTLNGLVQHLESLSTLRQITSTDNVTSTDTSTHPLEIEGSKPLNLGISTGNQGASTDRQTDRQTDTSTDNLPENTQFLPNYQENEQNTTNNIESNIKEASEILDSLDSLKKEIRLKFKHLTPQEMLVFSTIYQLEEQATSEITYKILSEKLRLSESSVRDYTQRMMDKGIPIKKHKVNNKKIILSISSELKKIASLNTIIQLRRL